MCSCSRRVILGLGLAFVAPLVMLSAQQSDLAPLIGTWKLNLAASRYDPGPPPKDMTRTFQDWGAGLFLVTNEWIDAQGNPAFQHFVARYDGKDYPTATRGSQTINMISYKRVDAYTVVYTSKVDRKVRTTTTRTVSRDGKTFTEQTTGTNTQGQAVNIFRTWDKQ